MTDEFDQLRAALKAAPPAPDPAARAATLARALENFEAQAAAPQETAPPPRPMSDRPQRAGFLTGVRTMLSNLTQRPVLAATASVAALCVGLVIVAPSLLRAPAPVTVPAGQPAKPQAGAETGVATGASAPPAQAKPVAKLAEDAAKSAPDASRNRAAPAPQPELDTLADTAGGANATLSAVPDARLEMPATESKSTYATPEPNTEAFANEAPNPVKIVADDPVSTFSIDIDTASYSVVRSSLSAGYLPPPDAVRIEEMVNYFPYAYPAPDAGEAPFRASVNLFPTPWNKDTQLLRIGLQGAMPAVQDRPPLDLVFLIDTSGSMEDANKLPLLVQSFRLMLGQLRPEDKVAIVTYAGSAGLVLEPTAASDKAAILGALDRLAAGGSTAGQDGLQQAYQVAETMKGEGRVGRILLATDGDFNVGIADPVALTDFIAQKRDSGTYLSVLGFGRGNLDDATMQALAQNGNGTAAYIDTLSEAQKVLVDQLTGALFPITDDVKIQIEFNPAQVVEYRLIGYETRALTREDFNNDRVDAGEIGAGRQVTALYEVVPAGSPARLTDPLRYAEAPAAAETGAGKTGELGFLKLRWKAPGADQSQLMETPIAATVGPADDDARFAAAIAGFGQLLTGGTYLQGWGWQDAITLAAGAKGADPFGYRAEAVQFMRLAESLADPL